MLCGEIDTVQAATADGARHFAVEDTAAAVLRFASGALGTLTLSDAVSTPWNWEWTRRRISIYPHEPQSCLLRHRHARRADGAVAGAWWHEPGQGWGDPLTRRRFPTSRRIPTWSRCGISPT